MGPATSGNYATSLIVHGSELMTGSSLQLESRGESDVNFWHNRDLPPSSHEVRFRAMTKPASITDLGAIWPIAACPLPVQAPEADILPTDFQIAPQGRDEMH